MKALRFCCCSLTFCPPPASPFHPIPCRGWTPVMGLVFLFPVEPSTCFCIAVRHLLTNRCVNIHGLDYFFSCSLNLEHRNSYTFCVQVFIFTSECNAVMFMHIEVAHQNAFLLNKISPDFPSQTSQGLRGERALDRQAGSAISQGGSRGLEPPVTCLIHLHVASVSWRWSGVTPSSSQYTLLPHLSLFQQIYYG